MFKCMKLQGRCCGDVETNNSRTFFMLSVSSGYLTLYLFMVLHDAHHCSV